MTWKRVVYSKDTIMIDFFPNPYSFNAMLKPGSWSCGHSGCLVCLRQLTKSTANPKCPVGWREFQASTISVNIALDHITSKLAVECQSQRCDWKGKYARAWAHQNQCTKLLVQTRDAHSVRLEKKCRSTENLAARGRSPLWWSHSVGFVVGARTIPVYKRHKTISLRLRENISQITMLSILVTLLMCSQYGRFSKEVWMAFSQTCWR